MCGKVIYKCTNQLCGAIYRVEHRDDLKEDEITGGFCQNCALAFEVRITRLKQRKEGNPDCYAKSNGYCDRFDCNKRSRCLNPNRKPANEIEALMEKFPSVARPTSPEQFLRNSQIRAAIWA